MVKPIFPIVPYFLKIFTCTIETPLFRKTWLKIDFSEKHGLKSIFPAETGNAWVSKKQFFFWTQWV